MSISERDQRGGQLVPTRPSRILRPRNSTAMTPRPFPTWFPDATTGKITYDVDNDGDGVTDSVWLDLGYPARRDSSGQLYKPLFAFMVIGLNGRIPLNTAGNLAGNAAAPWRHPAAHLGNSVSEVDPTYALQNAIQGPDHRLRPLQHDQCRQWRPSRLHRRRNSSA